ncbi:hypothetical protein Phi46:1_gp14 [Cellulophaga phage phi46:1]|uniref:hypothetical protein n=1 Tax=Cellulophaga phage phi46:1 TaxID=1327974 RepID=UPI000351919D|nr:hypothetical protein Phi46:1_gp14 [Cellulophaga phage phi46:1]AGO47825.1 hypothetical protein Phi46:1_gp14 [Cellulophaga phage phi46:1]
MASVNRFIEVMAELLQEEDTALLTDSDIYYLVNDQLKPHEKISISYFNKLKASNQTKDKTISKISYLTDEEKQLFIDTMNLARARQKRNLTNSALNSKNAYPFLWILERKNTDLQLNKAQEGGKNVSINISVGSESHKGLIEDILNDTIEIDHEEIKDGVKLLKDG